jgi:putative ABC transport system permease protein
MGGVWYAGRREVRRRWPALVLLVVVLGTAGGAVLAAVAGARRTASAFDRFLAYAGPGDAFIGDEAGRTGDLVDAINRLPQVERAIHYWQPALFYEDPSLYDNALVPLDDRGGKPLNRPRMVAGRRPAGDAPDEVALSERSARRLHTKVGGTLTMQAYDEADLARSNEVEGPIPDPGGPRLALTVVGIYRAPDDVLARPDDISVIFLSPAFAAAHQGRDVAGLGHSLLVRLRDGPRDIAAFLEGLGRLPGADALHVDPASTSGSGGGAVETTTGTVAAALTAFAAALAAALLVVLGAALARLAGLVTAEQPVLAAVGFSRKQRAAGLLLPGAVVAAAGTALALAVAVGVSPLFPIGVGRRAEIDPGLSVDGPALALGGLGLAVAVMALAGLAAWRAGGLRRSVAPGRRARWSDGLAGWLAGRPPLATAARIGLGAGQGASAAPVRPALVGAVTGVIGVVAALTFGAGLGHLLATPRLYGAPWSAALALGDADEEAAVAALAADPGVQAVGRGRFDIEVVVEGRTVTGYTFEPLSGDLPAAMVSGRPPQATDEIALAADTLAITGKRVGARLQVEGPEGAVTMRIVGQAVFSAPGDPRPMTDGVALTEAGARVLGLPDDSGYRQLLVRWSAGRPRPAAVERLVAGGADISTPAPPPEVSRLDDVRAVPNLLAAFLAVLGAVAVAGGLATVVSRRRRELAVLRTLGFTPGETGRSVFGAGLLQAAVALALGFPLGIALGRVVWRAVAGSLGVARVAVVPPLVLLVLAGVPLLAVAVAALPARRAARLRPALVLRAE